MKRSAPIAEKRQATVRRDQVASSTLAALKPSPASQASNPRTDVRRSSVAVVLMVLSLILGSGNAAVARQAGEPAARAGPDRHGTAAAFARAPERRFLSDDASESKTESTAPPRRAGVVTDLLGIIQSSDTAPAAALLVPQPGTTPYRARAPPAV